MADAPVAPTLDDLTPALVGGTVAIGNFDGVHRGHQQVLTAALAGPRPAIALTFEPHPREFFGKQPIFRLTPAAEKARLAAALGLDGVVVAPFDADLAALSADAFIAEVLVKRLAVRHVVVGHDFAFGARRSGTAETLAAAGARHGFTTQIVAPYGDEGTVISSSRIRELLAEGDVAAAAAQLGYRFQVSAPVIHGEKRGRELGYPTANQALSPACGLAHGIYAVRARIDGAWRDGVASFGRRPTFHADGAPLLETFVFDFAGDLYGKVLTVTLVAYIRPELKFDGVDALIAQMDRDSEAARAALAGLTPLGPLDRAVNFR